MYIELHAASAFSFLDGASLPEALVERAASLGYPALALLDRDGVYGAPRFHQAAKRAGLKAIIGAELTIALALGARRSSAVRNRRALVRTAGLGVPASDSFRLPVLVETQAGYRNLCRLVTRMKLRAPKGEGALALDELDGARRRARRARRPRGAQRAALRRRRARRSPRRHLRRGERRASSCSGICCATKRPTTRRSWIWRPRFTCRSSRPTACASPSRPIGRSTTCSRASVTRRRSSARGGGWRGTPSGI